MCMSPMSVMQVACYLDSGETHIIKIRIAKKNTENLKNRNVLYTQKFLALRYLINNTIITPHITTESKLLLEIRT